jgi:hypothetical protein
MKKKKKGGRTEKVGNRKREGAWMMLVPVVQLIEAVDEVNVPRHAHCAVAQDLEVEQQKKYKKSNEKIPVVPKQRRENIPIALFLFFTFFLFFLSFFVSFFLFFHSFISLEQSHETSPSSPLSLCFPFIFYYLVFIVFLCGRSCSAVASHRLTHSAGRRRRLPARFRRAPRKALMARLTLWQTSAAGDPRRLWFTKNSLRSCRPPAAKSFKIK